ncbi:hypothetical protein [Tenacibaculum jejuense]|uniref:Uncharacterized protein n=1 Tax=Tenacibaculum jejuense TaxID=584609 RepID=A0A238UCH8_9FLAO|nr:hypothetical protein [Tenacibaculum jejuense]SNR16268.1 conserved protein of unknown function [Tenacibaculum jejuense]
MKKIITIKQEYNSLEKLQSYINEESNYSSNIQYDKWEIRKDNNGNMQKCIMLKKSAMHGLKVYFLDDKTIELSYAIPNVFLHGWFGKSQKAYRGIDEIILGKIKDAVLVGSQKKAFTELEQVFNKATV